MVYHDYVFFSNSLAGRFFFFFLRSCYRVRSAMDVVSGR